MTVLRDFWFDRETLAYIGESPLPDDVVLPAKLISVQETSASAARRRVWASFSPEATA